MSREEERATELRYQAQVVEAGALSESSCCPQVDGDSVMHCCLSCLLDAGMEMGVMVVPGEGNATGRRRTYHSQPNALRASRA